MAPSQLEMWPLLLEFKPNKKTKQNNKQKIGNQEGVMQGAGRGQGRGRGRGRGAPIPPKPSRARQFASITDGEHLQERRGGQRMAELVNAQHASESSSSQSDEVLLDDEHIVEEINARQAQEHSCEEGDNDEEDDDEDEDEDEVEEGSSEGGERMKRRDRKERSKKRLRKSKKKTSVVHHFFDKGESDGLFVCKLHALMPAGSGHSEFVRQGGLGTSNLLSHVRHYHEKMLAGLTKAWNESRDIKAEWDGLVALMKPPLRAGMERFVSVVSRSDVALRKQLSLLMFFVASSLSFNVLDSSHFQTFVSAMGGDFPSRKSLVELLPSLFTVVLSLLESKFVDAGFFSTTFDLWTSIAGTKYCVITYHTMSSDFELFSAPLDFIPLSCSAFSEFLYHAIETRLQAHPFASMVHVASFTDSGSNVQAAKEMLVGGDAESCFNHDLKLVIDYVLVGTDARCCCTHGCS